METGKLCIDDFSFVDRAHPFIFTIFANMAYVGKMMYVIYLNAWYESD